MPITDARSRSPGKRLGQEGRQRIDRAIVERDVDFLADAVAVPRDQGDGCADRAVNACGNFDDGKTDGGRRGARHAG